MVMPYRLLNDRVARREPVGAPAHGGVPASEFTRLEMVVERHSLLIESLIRMLIDRNVCTADELNDLARIIDEEDGRVDGRRSSSMMVARGAVTCPSCSRLTPARLPTCQWCAKDLPFQYV